MNELYEPNSALFGVLVARPGAASTASLDTASAGTRSSKVVFAALGVALLSLLWWMVAA